MLVKFDVSVTPYYVTFQGKEYIAYPATRRPDLEAEVWLTRNGERTSLLCFINEITRHDRMPLPDMIFYTFYQFIKSTVQRFRETEG
jgi:hypothetical protein